MPPIARITFEAPPVTVRAAAGDQAGDAGSTSRSLEGVLLPYNVEVVPATASCTCSKPGR